MGSSHTPFAAAAKLADPGAGCGADEGQRGPGRVPTRASGALSLLTAASGRPPLPPCGLSGGISARKASLANILLDDSFDNLLPLSPSLDNFLTHAGSTAAGMDSRPSLLNGRLFSMSAGRLSTMNSFDLGWLIGDGSSPGAAVDRGRSGAVEDGEAMQVEGGSAAQHAQHAQRATAAAAPPMWPGRAQQGSLKRRHSAAELVVGSPQLGPQLPAVPPLLVQASPMQSPPARGTAAPHTPVSTDAAVAKKAAVGPPEAASPAPQRLRQQPPAEQAAAAAADAAGAAAASAAASQDPAQCYAAQCQAAAAHAAQAMTLQQQMQMQQVALGCTWGLAGSSTGPPGVLGRPGATGGSAAGTNSSNSSGTTQCNAELLAQYSASQAAATAAIYGRPAAHPSGQMGAARAEEAGGGMSGLAWGMGGSGDGMGASQSLLLSRLPDPAAAAAAGGRWEYGRLCGGAQQAPYSTFGWQSQAQANPAAYPQPLPAQRSGGGSSNIQAKIDEWERQNALMAAFSSGNTFPELAASAACTPQGLMWAAAAGAAAAAPYAPSCGGFPQPTMQYQYPQQYPHYTQQYSQYTHQYPQQHQPQSRSVQVTLSTAPALRLATTGAPPLKLASQTPGSVGSGGDVAISSSDSEAAGVPAALPAGAPPNNAAPAGTAPNNAAPAEAAAKNAAPAGCALPSPPAVTAGADGA